jgi:hypothetical protein
MYRDESLRTCLDELERTGDVKRLKQEYPHFIEQIQSFWNARRLLEGSVPQLEDERLLTLKHEFLTTISAARPKRVFNRLSIRLAGLLGIGGVLVAASLGASAAGLGPAQRAGEALEAIGVNHGNYVSEAVQDAKDATPPGHGRGEAVSSAACEAAHDRSTLPQSAQDAPGQEDKEAKDCSKSDETSAGEKSDNAAEQVNESAPAQDLKSTEPGRERGMAACTAAAENQGNQGQAAGNAAAQALENIQPGCDPQNMGGNATESGHGSGGKPAELPAPAAGRP